MRANGAGAPLCAKTNRGQRNDARNFSEDLDLTRLNVQLDAQEIQDFTHRWLGRFFIAFASLELNLALQVGGKGDFHQKLERFSQTVISQLPRNNERYVQILRWYRATKSIRILRNRFAHGRWGFLPHTQSVVHVKGYPGDQQTERHFSLVELDSIVKKVELLDEELCNWVQSRGTYAE